MAANQPCLTEALEQAQPAYPVVCLIGSSRFFDAFQQAYFTETMALKIVLSLGFAVGVEEHGETVGITPDQKQALDCLHLAKVAMADEVLVLNQNGYIGISTARELVAAVRLGKVIRWLEPLRVDVPPPCPRCFETRVVATVQGWNCPGCGNMVSEAIFPSPAITTLDEERI